MLPSLVHFMVRVELLLNTFSVSNTTSTPLSSIPTLSSIFWLSIWNVALVASTLFKTHSIHTIPGGTYMTPDEIDTLATQPSCPDPNCECTEIKHVRAQTVKSACLIMVSQKSR